MYNNSIREQIKQELSVAQAQQAYDAIKKRTTEMEIAKDFISSFHKFWSKNKPYLQNTMDFLEKIYNAADLTNNTNEWESFVDDINRQLYHRKTTWAIDDSGNHGIAYKYRNRKWKLALGIIYTDNYTKYNIEPVLDIRYGRKILHTTIDFKTSTDDENQLVACPNTEVRDQFPDGHTITDAEKLVATYKEPTLVVMRDCVNKLDGDLMWLGKAISSVYEARKDTFSFPTINITYDMDKKLIEAQGDYLVKNGLAVVSQKGII